MTVENLKGLNQENQYQNIIFFRKGGMGEIYTSDDVISNEKKAIKIVPIENEEEYNLLKSEFDVAISLNHKNIVNTEYFGEFEMSGVRYIYCAMDFNKNGNLRSFINKQNDFIEVNQAIKLMLDLSHGLEYAHETIVHRDLKPENILISDYNELQICDFGLAKLIDSKTRTRTFKGGGTLPYMSPECWMFDSNTVRMDIYSLGIIFYEILALKIPFSGRTETEFRDKHLYEQIPNLSNIRRDLPFRLVEMINKMASKRPQDRYTNVTEIITVLKDLTNNNNATEGSKIDALLQKANQKVSLEAQRKLEQAKIMEEQDSKRKFLEYSINALFDFASKRIDELNQNLERTKISYHKSLNQFTARFMDKSFTISFFQGEDIEKVIQRGKQANLEFQKRQHGMIFQKPPIPFLEKDNVILIGKAVIDSSSYNSASWGYNLLLRKTNHLDPYGEWSVVWFDDSALVRKHPLEYHYAIDVPEFYQEYEFGRTNIMHIRTMAMNSLKSEGIDKMIEKILE